MNISYDTAELSDTEDLDNSEYSEELKDIIVEKPKEFDKLPIDKSCSCKKIYNYYKPKPYKCTMI